MTRTLTAQQAISANAWPNVRLGDVLSVQNGFAFSSKNFSKTDGTPLIRIRDLKSDAGTSLGYVGDYDDAYLVHEGDLLIGMDGEFACHEWTGGPALLNQRVCRLQNFSNLIEPRFVFYGINKFLKEIQDATTFTTVKHLSSKKIQAIEFALPPIEEQKRIVAVLDQAFAALDRARVLVKANLADARQIQDQVREAELDNRISDSVETTIGEICDRFEYGTSAKSLPSGKMPVLRMGNIQDGEIDWTGLKYTDDAGDIEKLSLKNGDILFNRTNSIEHVGKTAIFRGEREAIFAGYLIRVHYKKDQVHPDYLNIFLNSDQAKAHGRSMMGKSVNQANISASKLKTYPITLPPLANQRKSARKIDSVRELTAILRATSAVKLRDIEDLRQSILQKALSGKLV